jgi:hypothetical protein
MLEPNRENWPYFQNKLKFRNLVTRKPEKKTHTYLAILNFFKTNSLSLARKNKAIGIAIGYYLGR